jgi:G3E family GTPase
VAAEKKFTEFPEMLAQIAWADLLVITQSDLATSKQIERLHARLDDLAPETIRTVVSYGVIIANLAMAMLRLICSVKKYTLDFFTHCYSSIALHREFSVPWPSLESALLTIIARYPEQLIRLKGVIYTPDTIEPLLVEGVRDDYIHPPEYPFEKLITISDNGC